MTSTAHILKQALDSAKLSLDDLAMWARIDVDLLRKAESGLTRLTAAQLDRVACVFGLRLDDLLEGKAGSAPMTLLLRSGASDSSLDIRSVLTTEVDQALGEFQRVVRDAADLEELLGLPRLTLPMIKDLPGPSALHPGDRRARLLRDFLGLGLAPIPSVRQLIESLGVFIVWVSEDQIDSSVEGACTQIPRPAILVNIIEEGRHPWRARMTLAHELGHLLFDLTHPARQVLVSPHGGSLPPWLNEIEQNARAFGACLLAPTEAVRQVVGIGDPTSEEAIQAVGKHFGVGRTVAINRLQDVFALTDVKRASMEYRQPRRYDADFGADVAPSELGLRGGPFRSLVATAVGHGKIKPDRARKLLGIDPTEPLPFDHLPPQLVAPSITIEHKLVRTAAVHLGRQYPQAGLVPGEPSPFEHVWHVPVVDGGVGATGRSSRGYLVLSSSGQILEDQTVVPREPGHGE